MTIKDIAKSCGVSVSTVSRVLNDRPDVSEDVRRRVLSVVEATGYIPNNSARELVKSSSDTIGVVVRGTGNLFFSAMLKALSSEIDRRGYTMALRFIDTDADEVKAAAILEREKRLRGIMFLGGRQDYTPAELSLVTVPYICCSYSNHFGSLRDSDYSSISIDDRDTAYRAVDKLISLGHERIAALVASRSDRSISELRYEGYRSALRDHGIEFQPELLIEAGNFEMDDAYRAMNRLIESGTEFSAVFAISDTSGLAAIKALSEHGIKVPEECSVIGIDGLYVSQYFNPTLSTMVQPAEEMGRQSVDILLNVIEKGADARHVRVEAKLREGGSLAKK